MQRISLLLNRGRVSLAIRSELEELEALRREIDERIKALRR